MPNMREALTKAELGQEKRPRTTTPAQTTSALNHSANATLHAYHPGRGQVNAQPAQPKVKKRGKCGPIALNESGGRRLLL